MSEPTGTWGAPPGSPPPDVGWGEAPAWGEPAAAAGWDQPAVPGGWEPPVATSAVPAAADGWGGGAAPETGWETTGTDAAAWGQPAEPDAAWGAPAVPADAAWGSPPAGGGAASTDAAWGLPPAGGDAAWGEPAAPAADAAWGAPAPAADAAWGTPAEPAADAAWGLPPADAPAADAAWGVPAAAAPASDAAWGLPAPADDAAWGVPAPDAGAAFDPLAAFEADAPTNDAAFFDAFLQDIQNGEAAPEPAPPVVLAKAPVHEAPAPAEPVYEAPAYVEPAYAEPAYAEPAYEAPAYVEPAPAEPAYEAPAPEPAYDEQTYGDQPAYDDDQVYGDEPPAEEPVRGYETLEAEYEAADEAADEAAAAEDEWDPLADPGLWDDGAAEADAEPAPAPAAKGKAAKATPAGNGKVVAKQLAIAASSIAMLGAMSAGGWYLATDGGEKPVPGIGMASLGGLFGGGPEDAEIIDALKGNASVVRDALEDCIKATGKPPKSQGDLQVYIDKRSKTLVNPFHEDEELAVMLREQPVDPGVVAVSIKDDAYVIRVGDREGKPLKMGEQEFQLTGGMGTAVAAKPSTSPEFPTAARSPAAPGKPGKPPAVAPQASVAPPELPPAVYPPAVPLVLLVGAPGAPTVAGAPPEPAIPEPEASIDIRNVTKNKNTIQRNRAFDTYRLRGIALVYEARTAEAVVNFKRALAIKPNDPAVQAWLTRVEEASAEKPEGEGEGGGEGRGGKKPEAAVDQDQLIRQKMEEIGKRGAVEDAPPPGAPKLPGRAAPAEPALDGTKPPLLPPPKL